ncbi:MAG: CpaF family protein [Planctomyces sp.]|nr:CpaF family protein [Planctomyces sp.]
MVALNQNSADESRAFQQLKTRLHRQMVDSIDMARAGEIGDDEFRRQLHALASHLVQRTEASLPCGDRDRMVRELMDEVYGFGPLQALMNDPEVSDVLVNGADAVFVERNGILERTSLRFADDAHLLNFIQRLVGQAGRRIDEVSPMVDAKLPDGSRLHAVIPPLALRGPTLSIRRFKTRIVQFEDMVRTAALAPEMADFLIAAVRARLNIVLSGGTGAGKTTLLNNLSRFIPAAERVVTIEETAELQLQQADVVGLETRVPNVEGKGHISQRDLLRNSLRMRPDRIIVGEARGGEVLDMLQAMNTGHDGSMSTLHANDTRDALHRLELMIALSGAELPTKVARQYVASAIQLFVHVARLSTGERKIVRISELAGVRDGEFLLEDIFVYRSAGMDADGRLIGSFYATGYEPAALRRMAGRGIEIDPRLFATRELATGGDYCPETSAPDVRPHVRAAAELPPSNTPND